MPGSRIALIVVAALIGVAAVVLGNWWTFSGMVVLIVSQALAERSRRRALAPAPTPLDDPQRTA